MLPDIFLCMFDRKIYRFYPSRQHHVIYVLTYICVCVCRDKCVCSYTCEFATCLYLGPAGLTALPCIRTLFLQADYFPKLPECSLIPSTLFLNYPPTETQTPLHYCLSRQKNNLSFKKNDEFHFLLK